MRTKARTTFWSTIQRAAKIKGAESSKPPPQMTGSIQAIFSLSQRLSPLPNISPTTPAALKMAPK